MLLEQTCLFCKVLSYVHRNLNMSQMTPALEKLTKKGIRTTTLELRFPRAEKP